MRAGAHLGLFVPDASSPEMGDLLMRAASGVVPTRAVLFALCAILLGGAIWKAPGLGSGLVSALTATFVVASPGIAVVLYLIPTLIAQRRDHPQTSAIFAVNLFVGWTCVGWVLALGWSIVASKTSAPDARPSAQIGEVAAISTASRTVRHVLSGRRAA